MSEPGDTADAGVRRLFVEFPRPELPAGFSRNVIARVLREEELRPRRLPGGSRLALAAYWLAAAVASAFILHGLPWPAGWGLVAWGLAFAATPVAYAVALFPKRMRAWLVLGLSMVLPRLDP